ncbi:type II toxin-antitoxin system RatA family toxin [Piscirickettsia salmonis]|uniref:type II toxin-antitoxin system RatA family toxin n=1 Tax=Piscirickettsia salmonis TaxID=1238 RepID=UPI0007D76849|nr:Persistence and stress-resistance toxin PasT [Piscirickettsiaceae bacterium NZ-RLO1]
MKVNRKALVPYCVEEMYPLIQDIEHYAEFLPWCSKSVILSESDDAVVARLTISRGSLKKSFTTRNRGIENQAVYMELVEGPFRSLTGCWRLEPLADNACRVLLDVEFEFSNKLVAIAFGPIFNTVVSSMVDAFLKRARVIYGEREL